MATWSPGGFQLDPEQDRPAQQNDPSSILPSMGRVNYQGPKPADAAGHYFKIQGSARELSGYTPPPDKEYDWLSQAEKLSFQTAQLRQQAMIQRQRNATIRLANTPVRLPNMNFQLGGSAGGGGGRGRFGAFINAIAGQESGGNYGAVNPHSGAMGKYQIMPSNIEGTNRGWDYEALGRDISRQQFLSNPQIQERIARYKLRQYFDNYGPRGAASAWYSGDPNKWRNTASQGAYPSIARYVQMIMRRMRDG